MVTTVAWLNAESLRRRMAERFVAEEEAKQQNMEAIAAAAVPLLKPDAKPEKIERDWLVNFFDKSRLTSDEEMRQIWAKILAGEANAPGKFSRRTVGFMASLDKKDAEIIRALCRFNWLGFASQPTPVIFETNSPIYLQNGINWANVVHLEEIGFLTFESFAQITIARMDVTENLGDLAWFPEILMGSYGNTTYAIYPGRRPAQLGVGRVKLSQVGSEVAAICEVEPVPGFASFAISHWEAAGAKVREVPVGTVLKREMFGI
jgi:hypothetical protein